MTALPLKVKLPVLETEKQGGGGAVKVVLQKMSSRSDMAPVMPGPILKGTVSVGGCRVTVAWPSASVELARISKLQISIFFIAIILLIFVKPGISPWVRSVPRNGEPVDVTR